jgi:uncharacterized membrane protein YbhN (UPF0104 family)
MAAVDMFPPSHRDRCVTLEIRVKMAPGKGVRMKKLRIWASVCVVLAIVALVSLLFMHLALTDIYHGENDPSLEWTLLRLGFLVIVFLIVATFISTGLVFKHFRELGEKEKPKLKD